MKKPCVSLLILLVLFANLALATYAQPPGAPVKKVNYKAVLVGIDYKRGEQWHKDATDLQRVMLTWGNWRAPGAINLQPAGAAAAGITAALAPAALALGPNDLLLYFYSGHASNPREPRDRELRPAFNDCDEYLVPMGGNQSDDALTATEAGSPTGTVKLNVFDACFSGGFWNGNDRGDLEWLTNTVLLASVPENMTSPGTSPFARALIDGAKKGAGGIAPADSNGDAMITVGEWFDWANARVTATVTETVATVTTCSDYSEYEENPDWFRRQRENQGAAGRRMSPQYFDSGEAGLRDVVVFYDPPVAVASIPALSDRGTIGLSVLLAVSLGWMLRHRLSRDAHADKV